VKKQLADLEEEIEDERIETRKAKEDLNREKIRVQEEMLKVKKLKEDYSLSER